MPDTQRILTAAERQADVADALSATYARELAAVKVQLETRLRRLILDAQGGSQTAIGLAARGLVLRKELRDILALAGYDDLADAATITGLDTMAQAIASLRKAAEVTAFTSADATRIAALKELARLDLLAQGDGVSTAVWRSVVQGIYAQRSPADILGDLSVVLEKQLTEVSTLYDTSVSIFGRQLELLKSDRDPGELLVFVGPVDDRIRPFCLQHVGKVYTAAEVDQMVNGQLPNVRLTAGGYSCRHLWAPLSGLSELRDLYGTGERVSEVATDVKALNARREAKRAAKRRSA